MRTRDPEFQITTDFLVPDQFPFRDALTFWADPVAFPILPAFLLESYSWTSPRVATATQVQRSESVALRRAICVFMRLPEQKPSMRRPCCLEGRYVRLLVRGRGRVYVAVSGVADVNAI